VHALEEAARQRRDSMLEQARQRGRCARVRALNRARRRAALAGRLMSRARAEARRPGRERQARA